MYVCLHCEKEVLSIYYCSCGCEVIKVKDEEVDGLVCEYRQKLAALAAPAANKNEISKNIITQIKKEFYKKTSTTVAERAVKIEHSVYERNIYEKFAVGQNGSGKLINFKKNTKIPALITFCLLVLLVLFSERVPVYKAENNELFFSLAILGLVFIVISIKTLSSFARSGNLSQWQITVLAAVIGGIFLAFLISFLFAVSKYALILATFYNSRYPEILLTLMDVFILNFNVFIYLIMAPIVFLSVSIFSYFVLLFLVNFFIAFTSGSSSDIETNAEKAGIDRMIRSAAMAGRAASIGSLAKDYQSGRDSYIIAHGLILVGVGFLCYLIGEAAIELPFRSLSRLGNFIFEQTAGAFSFVGFINSLLIFMVALVAVFNKIGWNTALHNSIFKSWGFLIALFLGLNFLWAPLIKFLAVY